MRKFVLVLSILFSCSVLARTVAVDTYICAASSSREGGDTKLDRRM